MPNGGSDPRKEGRFAPEQTRAFSVHILTATGAGCALMALLAAGRQSWVEMFAWLGAALAIDGIDGPLARRYKVAEILPRWSGEALDFVVDFTTYVFVPAYAIAVCGLLPGPLATPLAVLIAVTGALYFADRDMKTDDNYFMGFPAIWNAAAFYLLLLRPAPWIGALAVAGLLVATFLPVRFIHPLRVARWRVFHVGLLILWALLALAALFTGLEPDLWVTLALCIIGIYILLGGLLHAPSRAKND